MTVRAGLPPRQRCVTVLLHHESDTAATAAVSWLGRHASAGSVDGFAVVSESPDELTPASVYSKGGVATGDLLDLLSKARVLETIRIVTLLASPIEPDAVKDLLQRVALVQRRINQTKARGATIQDVRVHAASADEQISSEGVFHAPAFANIILIPHDRASDRSQARLVRRSEETRFAMHIGTELATLTGSWTGQTDAPLDTVLQRQQMGDSIVVHFSRSLVRALFCPPLPLDRVVAPGQGLPTPEGFYPSPSPAATLNAVLHETYPEVLRFRPGIRPASVRWVSLGVALREVPRRIFSVMRSLPRVLSSGLSRDVLSVAGDGVQELVGRESWLQVAFPDRQSEEFGGLWQENAERGIAILEQGDMMPIMVSIPSTIWSDLIARVLGIADGSTQSAEARDQTGEGRFLVTDPIALSVPPGTEAHSTVDILMLSLDPDPVEESTSESELGEGEDLPPPDVSTAPPAQARNGLRSRLSEGASLSLPIGGLTGAITQMMADEKEKADQRLDSMVAELRSIIEESARQSGTREVPAAIRILLAISAMATVFVVCVFTGLSKFTDLHWMSFRWQAVCWLVLTLLILVPATAVLAGTGKLRWVRLAIPLVLMAAAVVLAFHPSVRGLDFVRRNISQTFWPLWPISIAAISIGITARVTTPRRLGNWRSSLARLTTWATAIYGLFVAIYGASSWKSFFQNATRAIERAEEQLATLVGDGPSPVEPIGRHLADSTRQTILIATLAVCLVIFLVCLVIISVMWTRLEYANRDRAERFRFATVEARRASEERRKLQLLTTQWLGTASTLARLIWRPLGEVQAGDDRDQSDLIAANDLLKFDLAGLDLTERGHQLLLARLRSLLVRQGWLRGQYERAADTFLEMDPTLADAGLPRQDWPRPEACPAAIPLGDILAGRTTGRRWDFATSLYNGELDEALQRVITDNAPERVFEAVLRDPTAHRTVGAIDEDVDLPEFFEGLLPVGGQDLPIGLSNSVFMAGDPRREMRTFVSWPSGFLPMDVDHAEHVADSVEPSVIDGSVIIAVRCDLSQGFGLHEVAVINWDGEPVEPPVDPIEPGDQPLV